MDSHLGLRGVRGVRGVRGMRRVWVGCVGIRVRTDLSRRAVEQASFQRPVGVAVSW